MSEQIKATIIAHSKSAVSGKEIVTFELEYPRFIHSELMTHRMFSRNAASSRAIPVEKMIEQIKEDPAMPIHWGKNQAGMQAKDELNPPEKEEAIDEWVSVAAYQASLSAKELLKLGVHKQVVNRILEPYQLMKTVLTATEFENFFWLRNHEDAQPEIKLLAEVMLEALNSSVPVELKVGMWHTPYFGDGYWFDCPDDEFYMGSLEDALAISSSCCAQVSYRKLDDSLEKAQMVYKRLVESEPVHASPFEHQGTPIKKGLYMEYTHGGGDAEVGTFKRGTNAVGHSNTWQEGITHSDREGNLWSGNFCGWVQHRQLIPNNVKKG